MRALRTARALYGRVADSPREMAHVTWMEGKAALLMGSAEEAESLLDTAFRGFVRLGGLHEAALAALDLMAARAKSGRLESVQGLIRDVAEGFPADVGQAGVLRALGSVEAALSQGKRGDLRAVLDAAAGLLRRFRRHPLSAFEGLPRTAAGGLEVPFGPLHPDGGHGIEI